MLATNINKSGKGIIKNNILSKPSAPNTTPNTYSKIQAINNTINVFIKMDNNRQKGASSVL